MISSAHIHFYADDIHGRDLCHEFNREVCGKSFFLLCNAFMGVAEIVSPVVDLFVLFDKAIMIVTGVMGRIVIFFEALIYAKM